MYVQTNGNFVFEEILNSLSHGLAFLASVVGANLLISQVSKGAREKYLDDLYSWYHILHCCTFDNILFEIRWDRKKHTHTPSLPLSLSHTRTRSLLIQDLNDSTYSIASKCDYVHLCLCVRVCVSKGGWNKLHGLSFLGVCAVLVFSYVPFSLFHALPLLLHDATK